MDERLLGPSPTARIMRRKCGISTAFCLNLGELQLLLSSDIYSRLNSPINACILQRQRGQTPERVLGLRFYFFQISIVIFNLRERIVKRKWSACNWWWQLNKDSSVLFNLPLFIFTCFNYFIYFYLFSLCLLFNHAFFLTWIREGFMTEKRERIIFRVTIDIIFFKDSYIKSDSQWNYPTSLHRYST